MLKKADYYYQTDLDCLVPYMAPYQPEFDTAHPLTLLFLTEALKFSIVWLYHRDGDQFSSIAGSGDNEGFPLIRI